MGRAKSDYHRSLENLELPLELGPTFHANTLEQHILSIALNSPIIFLLIYTHSLAYFISSLNYKPLEG